MTYVVIAVNFETKITHYHSFNMENEESRDSFKERVKTKMEKLLKNKADEIFVFSGAHLAYHYDTMCGW